MEGRTEVLLERKAGSKGGLLVQVGSCSWGDSTSLTVDALGSALFKSAAFRPKHNGHSS